MNKTPFENLHFTRREFACKCGCGFDAVDAELLGVLEQLRRDLGSRPVIITSACRCDLHNRRVGGARNSVHKLGKAADIRVKGLLPAQVADYLERTYPGRYGIGRYATFTHIDVRETPARWGKN
ncbi:D-Ala-D-Ala carboxypeptidase family metallohydrolase [Oceanimonas baumannii]|uniref:Peptidase M15-like protein n=1 Tax=Oceanimonas baumannii TaxID=129578 RepID=A0A235CJI7_9GAMM|nr:D-Ala-D-Ala carboxypeptidase family metallohydrolase [Oceanimonas baumannii]OYD24692.1 serine/threonine protein kinase [Oceanimonas baumannii]TDW59437.1 peptidase M15-like protein [Oceanimonas baumannii]